MENISIFNYEVFYLDYLEGTLSDEDTRLLMDFFEEHPECRLEDPDLPILSIEEEMTFTGKDKLKQTDNNEAITLLNAEHFMISEAEGLLSNEKKNELNTFVGAHPELEKDRNRFAAVYYAPDEAVVFAHKAGLKQKRAFVLWPYVSGAVAAAIISFVFLMGGEGDTVGQFDPNVGSGLVVGQKIPATELPNETPKTIFEDEVPVQVLQAGANAAIQSSNPKVIESYERLASRPANSMRTSFDARELEPLNLGSAGQSTGNTDESPFAVAMTEDQKLANPIEPITSFISKKTKTDVDFGRQKKSEKDEKGRFFLKIGKFEFSKNKH